MDSSPSKSSVQLPLDDMSPLRPSSRPTLTRQPSLLPAFEPLSSSPPSQSYKRKFNAIDDRNQTYPTPIPTSSTGILPSSPPRRLGLQRTLSSLSERAPLSDLPTVVVPSNGEVVRFGRSSNSSDHQLPYNRHISRVHVIAQYQPPNDSDASGQILVECIGWNGANIRCGSRIYELEKGDTWVSTQPSAEIMLDVLDCRVMIKWPFSEQTGCNSTKSQRTWTEDSSPRRAFTRLHSEVLPSSPPPMHPRSPISPSPARHPDTAAPASLLPETYHASNQTSVQIFEDHDSDHAHGDPDSPIKPNRTKQPLNEKVSMSSLSSSNADDLSDQENENEENDPIVHSFGPFGSNILDRLNSFSHASPRQVRPQQRKRPLKESSLSPKRDSSSSTRKNSSESLKILQESPIKNHVINQLAFSRVHAMPISVIHSNLPAELRACSTQGASTNEDTSLTHSDLRRVLHAIPCVGEIAREGKDAAGKSLENEFYYLPEMDENKMRRDAVLGDIGRTSLRSVRKSHKQYYWKKPRV